MGFRVGEFVFLRRGPDHKPLPAVVVQLGEDRLYVETACHFERDRWGDVVVSRSWQPVDPLEAVSWPADRAFPFEPLRNMAEWVEWALDIGVLPRSLNRGGDCEGSAATQMGVPLKRTERPPVERADVLMSGDNDDGWTECANCEGPEA